MGKESPRSRSTRGDGKTPMDNMYKEHMRRDKMLGNDIQKLQNDANMLVLRVEDRLGEEKKPKRSQSKGNSH